MAEAHEDPILDLARRMKSTTTMSKGQFIGHATKAYKKSAKDDSWLPAELAAAIAHVTEVAEKVWRDDG